MLRISKEVSLPDLYKYALSEALQTSFVIPENVIDRIHEGIIKELKSKCTILIEKGLISLEDISKKLEYQVAPILEEAKKVNSERKFALNAEKENGLYCGISSVDRFNILEGKDNSKVLNDIRNWLCDLGTENDKFSITVWGCCNEIGEHFDKIRNDLKTENLLPDLFVGRKTSRNIDAVDSIITGADMLIHPVEMYLYAHDPEKVVKTDEIQMSSWTLKCQINKDGIRSGPSFIFSMFRPRGSYTSIDFTFPCCKRGYVDVTLKANIEFNVEEELKVQTWAVVLSFGINAAFNKSKSRKFSQSLKLRVRMHESAVSLRKRVRIEISKAKVDKFMEIYNHFKKFESALDGDQSKDGRPALLPDVSFAGMIDRYPWLLFIEALRKGGVDAAMEMVIKKPEVLRNLPADENNVLGVAFEELQIAKIMAEAIRNNIRLELIAGDGRGRFRYNNQEMATPEYTDAVFRNPITDEYFAVQFKYTDSVGNLEKMATDWKTNWSARPNNPDLPEALKLDNVQVIGPEDVAGNIQVQNLDQAIRNNFRQNDRIGFKHPIDDTETVKAFLDDNKNLLEEILDSQDCRVRKNLNERIKQIKREIERFQTRLKNQNENLERLTRQRQNAVEEGRPTEGIERGIENLQGNIGTLEASITERQTELQSKTVEMKTAENNMRTRVEEKIVAKYREQYWKDAAWKEAKLNVAVQAAIDGITTLICTSGDQWKKYKNGEISFSELVKTVTVETAVATGRGVAIGAGFSGLSLAAHYATAYGASYAGALTVASKFACPVFVAGVLLKQSYDILHHWRNGDITTAEMKKSLGRTYTSTAASIGGMVASSALIGGPVGLAVGAGLAIAVGVGDYFLGDKIWSSIFKENPEEALALMEKKINQLKENILKAAYDLFDLTEYATRDEVKERYKAAVLKYHPDKGGSEEFFHAIHAAYVVICSDRGF